MIQDSGLKMKTETGKSRRQNLLDSCFLPARLRRSIGYLESPRNGFTLVEMLIAFGVFAVVMSIAVTSLLSILEANYRARAHKIVVNNLHFAFENMSRNIRTGSIYHCGGGRYDGPRDCSGAAANASGDDIVAFIAQDGARVVYRKNGMALERSVTPKGAPDFDGDVATGAFLPITAPEVKVERLQFYVDGSNPDDSQQPRVLIVAHGTVEGKRQSEANFDIQTLVSQRLLDVSR